MEGTLYSDTTSMLCLTKPHSLHLAVLLQDKSLPNLLSSKFYALFQIPPLLPISLSNHARIPLQPRGVLGAYSLSHLLIGYKLLKTTKIGLKFNKIWNSKKL